MIKIEQSVVVREVKSKKDLSAFALLTYIEDWTRSMGMTKLIGSYGFSDKDPQGLLVEGFEHMPIIDSACNMPYLVNLVEELGYSKEPDCLSYRFDLSTWITESYSRITARFETNNGFTFVEFNNRRGLKPYIIPLLRMVNDTYSHLYGFVPAVDKDFRGRGVEIALALRLFDSCRKNGLTVVETHLVLESNTQMISELERAKCNRHKRFRVFGKDLI